MGDKIIYQNIMLTIIAMALIAILGIMLIDLKLSVGERNAPCEDFYDDGDIDEPARDMPKSKKRKGIKYFSDSTLAALERKKEKNEPRPND